MVVRWGGREMVDAVAWCGRVRCRMARRCEMVVVGWVEVVWEVVKCSRGGVWRCGGCCWWLWWWWWW